MTEQLVGLESELQEGSVKIVEVNGVEVGVLKFTWQEVAALEVKHPEYFLANKALTQR